MKLPDYDLCQQHFGAGAGADPPKAFHLRIRPKPSPQYPAAAHGQVSADMRNPKCDCHLAVWPFSPFPHAADGAFPGSTCAADFIRMEPTADTDRSSGGKWTDQETLLLLEGLELHGDNWQEIADHVVTKTKAQCLAHFLQLPIEERFLDELEVRAPWGACV